MPSLPTAVCNVHRCLYAGASAAGAVFARCADSGFVRRAGPSSKLIAGCPPKAMSKPIYIGPGCLLASEKTAIAPPDYNDYYAVGVTVWGDAEQLAAVAAKPLDWFPSWSPPGQTVVPDRSIGDGYIFFESRTWSGLVDWVGARLGKAKYDRLYWLVRTSCRPVGQYTYACRGARTEPWPVGLSSLRAPQHQLELLHLLLRAADGSVRDEVLRAAQSAIQGALAARPEWGAEADKALADGCELQAAV